MRFLIHGAVKPEAGAALVQKEHAFHTLAELSEGGGDVVELLAQLEKRQWNLLTTDRELVAAVYEKKIFFAGVIVLILPPSAPQEEDPDAPADHGQAVARLFERYRRLTPRRLYTVTRSRVKIRQLPGGR